jgi:hypothetical protein
MIDRCANSQSKDYKDYGARGILVCDRWLKFPNFLLDMEASFFPGATLEREDNEGNYDPFNVIWATRRRQAQNKRHTVYLQTPWGRISRGEASTLSGLSVGIIASRQRNGWSDDRIFAPENLRKRSRWDR